MATTVNWDVLREIAGFRAAQGCAITVYLDLDLTTAPTAADISTRVNSLLDEGQKAHESNRRDLTHKQRRQLRSDFERIRRYFEEEFDRGGARGVAVFCAGLDNYWRPQLLSEAVPDRVKVGGHFYLVPLVPLVGRGDGALVALVSRERGTIFRLRGGRLVEVADRFDEQPGRHDQGGWSQARYQRHIEELAEKHFRGVAGELDERLRRSQSLRLVVVTSGDQRAEFEEALSNEVKGAIVGWTQAPAHASAPELLEIVQPLLEESAAAHEAEIAARWREEAGKNARATSGWAATLEAASDGRVELFLFQEGANRPAWQCPACGRVGAAGGACPLDGTRMDERDDGLDLALHQTLAHGGSVLALRHQQDLESVEGIGALLRY